MVDLIVAVWIDLLGSAGGFLARIVGMNPRPRDEYSDRDDAATARSAARSAARSSVENVIERVG